MGRVLLRQESPFRAPLYAATLNAKKIITPPTKVQNSVISSWIEKKEEVDSVGDSDLIGFELNLIESVRSIT